jgi:histidine triad (HIT) family protein
MPENPQTDCPFCAIAVGEDDSVEQIAAGASWMAFFPKVPATPGHTLLIPRAHVPDLWAIDSELAGELMAKAIDLGRAIERALRPDGMNLITSKGEAGEQSIFHLHLHLVPRWVGDSLDIWPEKKATGQKAREGLGVAIRAELGA